MKTRPFIGEFNGSLMLKFWKVDEDGERIGDKAYFSMGENKVLTLLEHLPALEKFIELCEKQKQKTKEENDVALDSF